MSAVFHALLDGVDATPAILTNTTSTTILTATAPTSIAKIHVANISGSAVTVDLEITDGATSWYLEKARSIAANSSYEHEGAILPISWSLKAKSGDASGNLHIYVLHTNPRRR